MVIISSKAQEIQGLVNSTYSGLTGKVINPGSIADSRYYLDINILTTDIFYQTDMQNNAYGSFRLNGPSAMLNAGKHAFCIYDAARCAISFKKNDVVSTPTNKKGIYAYKIAGLAWGEIGLSYAYIFRTEDKDMWSVGLSLNYLAGAGGAFYTNNTNSFVLNNSFSDNVSNMNFNTGGGTGKGMGVDLGVVYQKKHRQVSLQTYPNLCRQRYQEYDYKLGVSLIDIGFIKLSKNAQKTNINGNYSDYLNGADSSLNYIYSDSDSYYSTSSNTDNNFSMYLPAALSIQYDYHYYRNWYFNGTFIQGLNLAKYCVRRPTMIAFTPRFEKRWFEVNLPLSTSDLKYFRLGLALRLWNFSIGTDNLLGSFGIGANKSFNAYAAIKINFTKGRCGKKHFWSNLNPLK